jgi:hypothetical protein
VDFLNKCDRPRPNKDSFWWTHALKLGTVDPEETMGVQAKSTANMPAATAETTSIDLGCSPPLTKSKCLEWLSTRYA